MDALVKIKGMLVNLEPVLAALAAEREVRLFRLVADYADPRDALSGDAFQLFVAPLGQAHTDLAQRLESLVKSATGVTPQVTLVDAAQLEAEERSWKAKAFEDRRGPG